MLEGLAGEAVCVNGARARQLPPSEALELCSCRVHCRAQQLEHDGRLWREGAWSIRNGWTVVRFGLSGWQHNPLTTTYEPLLRTSSDSSAPSHLPSPECCKSLTRVFASQTHIAATATSPSTSTRPLLSLHIAFSSFRCCSVHYRWLPSLPPSSASCPRTCS